MASEKLADGRTGKNGRHALVGMLGQAVFGCRAGYEDVNDAERLRQIRQCAGSSVARRPRDAPRRQPKWDASRRDGLPQRGTSRRLPIYPADGSTRFMPAIRREGGVALDMDPSVSPTHGEQEMSVWNGHFECTCYPTLFVFN
jgi:hypothetical protein